MLPWGVCTLSIYESRKGVYIKFLYYCFHFSGIIKGDILFHGNMNFRRDWYYLLLLLRELRNKACLLKYVNYICTNLQVFHVNELSISTDSYFLIFFGFVLLFFRRVVFRFNDDSWCILHGRKLSGSLELDHYFRCVWTFHFSIFF